MAPIPEPTSFLQEEEDALAVGDDDVDLLVAVEVLGEELCADTRLVVDLVGNELGWLALGRLDVEPIERRSSGY